MKTGLYKIALFFALIFTNVCVNIAASDSANIYITAVVINIAPVTADDYDGRWHGENFTINLTGTSTNGALEDTYYRINGGGICAVSVEGQPYITAEGSKNTLEYWSVGESGQEELPHKMIAEIKLDKTPPVVNILTPNNDAAVNESPVTITGRVSDALSGGEDVEVRVGDNSYVSGIESNGSFSVSGVSLTGGPNNIVVIARDSVGNKAQDNITVFLGWVLHLQVPYYEVGDYYSGAACAQIVLNYIRDGVAGDLTQKEIYNYGQPYNYRKNRDLSEMDPRAIDFALGHFDPYDPADWFNSQGCMFIGYNFDIGSYRSDKFTTYLRDVIHWMAYPVRHHWLSGKLVAWPNTPSVVPVYGTYNHWVIVNGAATSENPTPHPILLPFYTPDFTVYGLWVTDPAAGGIGQDLYITADEAKDTYFLPVVSADKHNGEYVQIKEPPEVTSEAKIEMARPNASEETRSLIKIAGEITKDISDNLSTFERRVENAGRHVYDAAMIVDLKDDATASGKMSSVNESDLLNSVFDNSQKPVEIDWKKIIDFSILTDKNFKKAFDGSQARSFFKVRRLDKEDSFYYLIPFDKYIKGQFLTYAAIIINAEDGSFKEASWVKEPTRFVQISEEKARELALVEFSDLQDVEITIELIWEPSGFSQSPFYPYWKIVSGDETCFVTQDGKVITNDE